MAAARPCLCSVTRLDPSAHAHVAGIVVDGSPKDSCLRRLLIGTSVGAVLAQYSPVPILYLPSAQIVRPAQPCCVPETLEAMRAQALLQRPGSWQQRSAAAA